jgi:ribosomal protein L37AE/L43A
MTKKVNGPITGTVIKNKYRYVCPACTNNAFLSPDNTSFGSVVCQNCGKTLDKYQPENYIKL